MSLRQLRFCFHASLFICHLLLSVSVCFFVFFSSCIKRNHFNRDGISYYTTLKKKKKNHQRRSILWSFFAPMERKTVKVN